MSYEELDRVSVIERVIEKRLTQLEAARMLGLTSRQVRRLRRAYERDGPGGSGRIPSLRPSRERQVRVGSPPTTQARSVAISRGASGIRGSCRRRLGLRRRRSSAASSRSGDNARRLFRRRDGVIRPSGNGGGPRDPVGGRAGRPRVPHQQQTLGIVRFERVRSRRRSWPRRASSGYLGDPLSLKLRPKALARLPTRARRPRRQQRSRERPGRAGSRRARECRGSAADGPVVGGSGARVGR